MDTLIHRDRRAIIMWLCLCMALVGLMVLAGGYTRLSGSGLSITQWKPVHGVVPPLTQTDWWEEFEGYRLTPQYQKINSGMTLEEFKSIFWPEFFHRLLGRLVGVVFFVPWLVFALRKSFSRKFALQLLGIFILGGLQGAIGWLMVKSGFVDNPYVSHIRLAIHLAMAFLVFGLLEWMVLGIIPSPIRGEARRGAQHIQSEQASPHPNPPPNGEGIYFLWLTLLCLQIIFGAFVAGLHAGLFYNTWPMMNGRWLPVELSSPQAWYENLVLIQFVHRTLAVLVAIGFLGWWYSQRKNSRIFKACCAVAAVIGLQFLLGVLTLIHQVPLPLAMAHQFTALMLFALAVMLLYKLRHDD